MLSSTKNSNNKRRLVELKAVDENWPLIGSVSITPKQTLNQSINNTNVNEVLIDKNVKNLRRVRHLLRSTKRLVAIATPPAATRSAGNKRSHPALAIPRPALSRQFFAGLRRTQLEKRGPL